MAAKTATRRAPARTKAAKPKQVVDEIDELEEDAPEVVEEAPKKTRTRKTPAKKVVEEEPDDEDLEDDEDEEPAPAKVKKTAKAKPTAKKAEPKYGTKWLAEYLSEQLGREIKPFELRAVLRKTARDGEYDREIGQTRERYEFAGPKDAIVKSILAKFKSGAVAADKKAKLAELKAKKAKGQKAAEEPEEELEDDVEDLDDDDEDDDEE